MRKTLVFLFLSIVACCVPAPKAHAQATIVNSCTIDENGTSGPGQCTISNVHPGDVIIAFNVTLTSTCPNYFFSDSLSLVYTNANVQCGANIGGPGNLVLALDYASTGAHSGSDTFSLLNHQLGFAFATIDEVSGISVLDTATGAQGTNATVTTTISSGNLTTANSGEYLIAGTWMFNGSSGAPTATAGSGFTIQTTLTDTTFSQYAEDKTTGAIGTYAGTYVVASHTASVWAVIAGAFTVIPTGIHHHKVSIY